MAGVGEVIYEQTEATLTTGLLSQFDMTSSFLIIFNFIFLTSKQLDGSLFAEEHSLATTGSPVAFHIVFTLFGIWWGSPHPLSSGSGGVSTWIL